MITQRTDGADVRTDAQPVGSRTLEIFEGTDRLNRWIYERFATSLGRRVLEVGSGIGNITQFLGGRDLVVATDVEDAYLTRLRDRFRHTERIMVRTLDLEAPDPSLEDLGCDSALAVNVLEHVYDDRSALRWLRKLVGKGGTLCIYVPALPVLYGSTDEALGHYRRYEQSELIGKLKEAGFRCIWCRWMNVLAIPGWFLAGRVLRRRIVSPRQVQLYDRLVPLLRFEDRVRLPIGMNLTAVAVGE